jgi:hypothetical protein
MCLITATATVGAAAVGQFILVKTPAAVVVSAADTDVCYGITQESGAIGASISVGIHGPTRATGSAAIAKGAKLAPDAAGKVKTAQAADQVIGEALEACTADGHTFEIFLNKSINVLA